MRKKKLAPEIIASLFSLKSNPHSNSKNKFLNICRDMGFNITHHTTAMSPSHTTFHRQQHNHVSLSNTLPFTTLISTANAYQSYTNFSAICITSHTHKQYYSSKLYFEQPVHVSNWSNNPLNLSQQQMEPCVSPSPTNKHSSSFKYVAPIT